MTCLQLRFQASFEFLRTELGAPGAVSDEDKIHVEWQVDTPHGRVSVYDYGDGCHECEPGCPRDPRNWPAGDMTAWHVGGPNQDAAAWLMRFLRVDMWLANRWATS